MSATNTFSTQLVEEKGERKKRMYNIALVLNEAIENKADKEYIKKGYLLSVIRNVVKRPDNMDELGDLRAHGDSCGGHGLNLEIDGMGSEAKILLNEDNKCICQKFIDKYVEEMKEFKF